MEPIAFTGNQYRTALNSKSFRHVADKPNPKKLSGYKTIAAAASLVKVWPRYDTRKSTELTNRNTYIHHTIQPLLRRQAG